MNTQFARDEYALAQKMALKEQKSLTAAGKNPAPAVLDEILTDKTTNARELGVMEIPADRIVGTVSAGRTGAFTAGFRPLLGTDTEFANKWISLCAAHLGEGIRDPILCYEYLGNFYVQEGNKRVSVLKHFGAPRIAAEVRRILPPESEEPRIRAYYEFLEFYQDTQMYQIQFRRPGDYAKLLSHLGKEPGEPWDEREKRTFSSWFRYFQDALSAQNKDFSDLLPEEALLLWLKVYTVQDLGRMTSGELRKSIAGLKEELKSLSKESPVEVKTEPVEEKTGIMSLLKPIVSDHIRVAFVHALHPNVSEWIAGHDRGRQYLEETMGNQVRVRSYFHADSPAQTEYLLEQAVADGASVVFTTTPQLNRHTLRMAVKYPKVKFLNCAVNLPYASIRSYYGRVYEAKFITGAIAGAMSDDGRIGYIGNAPIWGVPASINAFALGAQMTNPRARIYLRWSCLPGSPQDEFFNDGIRVVSNREIPTEDNHLLDGCRYGTYRMDDNHQMQSLASPVCLWGKFYEAVVRSVLSGTWEKDIEKQSGRVVNYWWGMESGLVDVKLSERLPEGVTVLAKTLRHALQNDTLHPFFRKIVAQDGTVKNDGSRNLSADELLRMDWLCDNVVGSIPKFEEIIPAAQPLVREQGIYQEKIPQQKEGSL